MPASAPPKRSLLWGAALITGAVLAIMLIVPGLAAGLGSLIGGLWVTVMGAVLALLAPLLGG